LHEFSKLHRNLLQRGKVLSSNNLSLSIAFIFQIALTENGYSADAASKTLSDPSDNTDENVASSLHVKPAPLRARAEVFLTKRRTVGERMRYDVRSLHPCVQEVQKVVYNGIRFYDLYVCQTHSILCLSDGYLSGECEPSSYTYVPALNKNVVSGCKCKAD